MPGYPMTPELDADLDRALEHFAAWVRRQFMNLTRKDRLMTDCVKVIVPHEACYIAIEGGGPPAYSEGTGWVTPGGARLCMDFDAHHRLVGIELQGNQPCQRSHVTQGDHS